MTQEREAERAAIVAFMREAIAQGYPAPTGTGKMRRCEHGQSEWEECITCYDEHLERALQAIERGDHLRKE